MACLRSYASAAALVTSILFGIENANGSPKVVAVGSNGMIIQSPDGGLNWFIRSIFGPTFTDVNCVKLGDCWAVGYDTIAYSDDYGVSWTRQSTPVHGDFIAVEFVNRDRGWAVGASGLVLQTSNGGDTWAQIEPFTVMNLRDVNFVDAANGWTVGDHGEAYRTTDGGATWTAQTSFTRNTIWAVEFIDSLKGWIGVGGEGVYETNDGGQTWQPRPDSYSHSVNDIHFVDESNGWVLGVEEVVKHTVDGGVTWHEQQLPLSHAMYAFAFLDANTGWIVGPNDNRVLYTSDGGQHWGDQDVGVTTTLWSVDVVEPPNTPPLCDFNGDFSCDIDDLNQLLAEGPIADVVPVVPGENDQYDLTDDSVISLTDLDQWLADAATENDLPSPYERGDANLDAVLDVGDFNLWNSGKFTYSLAWDDGDFNGDGAVDVSDFNLWLSNRFTPSDSVETIPEPGAVCLLAIALVGLLGIVRGTEDGQDTR